MERPGGRITEPFVRESDMVTATSNYMVTEATAADFVDSLPREVWTSPSGYYRMVMTHNGPTDVVSRVLVTDDAALGMREVLWALEVREAHDLLGGERWRPLARNGDQSHWREAFRELAKATGIFRP